MNVGEVFEGLGLCAWGVAFYAFRLRPVSRWPAEEALSHPGRSGP